jgi:acyl-CoA hydrolase
MEEYRQKLVTADEAVKAIKSGDWIDMGGFTAMVRSLDKALAKRKNELTDIKVWSVVTAYTPEIMQADPTGEVFTWNSWHFSSADRKLAANRHPVYYAPFRFCEYPDTIGRRLNPWTWRCSRSHLWISTASSTLAPNVPLPNPLRPGSGGDRGGE